MESKNDRDFEYFFFSRIYNISKEECFNRWEGQKWYRTDRQKNLGICLTTYDFDSWIEEYEQRQGGQEND